jgi:biotin carboxyl carrier protein
VRFEAEEGGRAVPVEITGEPGRYAVSVDGRAVVVDARQTAEGIWSILIGGASHVAVVTERDGAHAVAVDGEHYTVRVEEESRYIIRTRGAGGAERGQVLKAPMPGRVAAIEVAVGQTVAPGDGLIVLEAMKMQNEFKARVTGTVREIRAQVGQAVNPGDVLLVIE